ncbi:MAG TPA: helicase-related protein [Ktedonobacterales bacterium]|jgi:superfamily II DNA or RNA helicase
MALVEQLHEGTRLFDTLLGREWVVHQWSPMGNTLKLWFKDQKTGAIEQSIYALTDAEKRFQVIESGSSVFRADPELVRMVAEGYRLQHAYLFNPIFATETSLIDLLPHQFLAVYRHLLKESRLRFLLADDAGAGKTIMAGLYIREMLLRRLVRRVLIVPPAGLVGNWRRELTNLFRLRFRILSSADAREENPFLDPHNNLAIVSVDTLWREPMRSHLEAAPPYDLVVFDEAHKLSAWRDADLTIHTSRRYDVAELIAGQGRHLLLLSATPHMGKDEPYYFLWRLLEPVLLSSRAAFDRMLPEQKRHHLLRRMKEEMIDQHGAPLYKRRKTEPAAYPLTPPEQELYDAVTAYCQTYFNLARNTNRAAAGLAMSMLQRRLASSSYAILRSLERRAEKLGQELRELQAGRLTAAAFARQQEQLQVESTLDTKTGDEEEPVDGLEENEQAEQEVAGATASRTVDDLRLELAEVEKLCAMARGVYTGRHESKFEELRRALETHPNTKVLIFTEHRDTMDFLIERLRGMGHEGHIASIHGGLNFEEREQQVEFFRDPNGARYLVATDAAGEGINLQFCWLLINYDIPWNPARLEQRMGRVHRYKQTHDVLLINVIAKDTREGRVLEVLLDKLENIRRELGSDKVFDLISNQFSGQPLQKIIERAVLLGEVDEAVAQVESALDANRVRQELEAERNRVECSEVRALLDGIRADLEAAEIKRMMPAYVRAFFEAACARLGMNLGGDPNGIFWLEQAHEGVLHALEASYPADLRDRLTFRRELAMPPAAARPEAAYLHPGEAVFDAVLDLCMFRCAAEAERGAVFFDPDASEPYFFALAKVPIIQTRPAPDTSPTNGAEHQPLAEVLIGIRRWADGRCEEVPAHQLMTLLPANPPEDAHSGELPQALLRAAEDMTPVEEYLYTQKALPRLEQLRAEAAARVPERKRQLTAAYNLREAELSTHYSRLKEAVARNEPAARTRLHRCVDEMNRLEQEKDAALHAAQTEPDTIEMGTMQVYARALVLPMAPEEAERRRSDEVERIAMQTAQHYEERHGGVVEDVHDPTLKLGFDLRSTRPDEPPRLIEVKGRARAGEVELTPNEWAQAQNHGERYWLYVVFHCETPAPELRVIQNPAARGIAQAKGGVTIAAAAILAQPKEA